MADNYFEVGKLKAGVTEYVAVCANCEEKEVMHWFRISQAETQLLDNGWRKVNGQWFCLVCADDAKDD